METVRITLVIGGSRSGKSHYAENLARAHQGKRCFIATAEPFDDEMRERIAKHRKDRGDAFYLTIEEPVDLAGAIQRIPADACVAVIDCVTVWMGNLLFHHGTPDGQYPEIAAFTAALGHVPCDMIIVANETGQGIVPGDPESRWFRDHAGWLNQDLAALAHNVVWMVAGIPVAIKGSL